MKKIVLVNSKIYEQNTPSILYFIKYTKNKKNKTRLIDCKTEKLSHPSAKRKMCNCFYKEKIISVNLVYIGTRDEQRI